LLPASCIETVLAQVCCELAFSSFTFVSGIHGRLVYGATRSGPRASEC
jgi:hypothetical protein